MKNIDLNLQLLQNYKDRLGVKVIELFSADTPNGKKISIMLEEIGYEYKVTKIDIIKENNLNQNL